MFMVLSREDAIDGMRDMMGPADPEEAKKVAPERLVYCVCFVSFHCIPC